MDINIHLETIRVCANEIRQESQFSCVGEIVFFWLYLGWNDRRWVADRRCARRMANRNLYAVSSSFPGTRCYIDTIIESTNGMRLGCATTFRLLHHANQAVIVSHIDVRRVYASLAYRRPERAYGFRSGTLLLLSCESLCVCAADAITICCSFRSVLAAFVVYIRFVVLFHLIIVSDVSWQLFQRLWIDICAHRIRS